MRILLSLPIHLHRGDAYTISSSIPWDPTRAQDLASIYPVTAVARRPGRSGQCMYPAIPPETP